MEQKWQTVMEVERMTLGTLHPSVLTLMEKLLLKMCGSVTAAAKSLQSCLTLCDPINGSPPGSRPWDSPGKNTGVGCHFFLQCMKVKSESEVAQSCPTLSDPMDCSHGLLSLSCLRDNSVHGISQARVLEWGAVASSQTSLLVKSNLFFPLQGLLKL